jgi:rsbT antagonist protein RsbS
VRGAIPILRVGKTLLATIHVELNDDLAEAFQEDVLSTIERTVAHGLVIDISGLDMVDSYVARVLADTGRMAKLMGTDSVLVGMRPEVAATLVGMGYAMDGVMTALNVEDGMTALEEARRGRVG